MDRVSKWVKSIPLFLDDPESPSRSSPQPSSLRPKTSSPRYFTLIFSFDCKCRFHSEMSEHQLPFESGHQFGTMDQRPKSHSHHRKTLPLLVDTATMSPLLVSSWSSREKLVKSSSQKGGTLSAEEKKILDRGRLLCCLKVEIKAGVFKMLPVHQVLGVK